MSKLGVAGPAAVVAKGREEGKSAGGAAAHIVYIRFGCSRGECCRGQLLSWGAEGAWVWGTMLLVVGLGRGGDGSFGGKDG